MRGARSLYSLLLLARFAYGRGCTFFDAGSSSRKAELENRMSDRAAPCWNFVGEMPNASRAVSRSRNEETSSSSWSKILQVTFSL